ncbi:hypothetical protein PanWU01x14_325250, partial [Parasponia andersonii]
MQSKTQSNGQIKNYNHKLEMPKNSNFQSGQNEVEIYIYLDDPYDETNPTEPVGGRIVAKIFAGDEKSETASLEISGDSGCSGGLWWPATGSWWCGGGSPVICSAGQSLNGGAASCLRPKERAGRARKILRG